MCCCVFLIVCLLVCLFACLFVCVCDCLLVFCLFVRVAGLLGGCLWFDYVLV